MRTFFVFYLVIRPLFAELKFRAASWAPSTVIAVLFAGVVLLISFYVGRKEKARLRKQTEEHRRQTQGMRNVVNMVLDACETEVKQGTLKLKSYPLNEWLTETISDFSNGLELKGMNVRYDLDDAVRNVSFDAGKLNIVVSSLLVNAFEYGSPGVDVTISTQVTDKGSIRISVKNRCAGIDEADITKLFTHPCQDDHNKIGGVIGLSCSKILVEMHGGSIGVYSNHKGSGAAFWFELPLKHTAAGIECPSKQPEAELQPTVTRNSLSNSGKIKAGHKHAGNSLVNMADSTPGSADKEFLLKLNAIINDNIANHELNAGMISKSIAMSRSSLYNRMKVLTDISLNEYITKLRVEKAANMLKSTDLSILDISERTGFSNQRYFSTVFKHYMGKTPTGYRLG